MNMAHKPDQRYSYADYLTWPDDERWELIHGIPYAMTPAPDRRHQVVVRELTTEFTMYLRGKTCELYSAPFDVRLPHAGKTDEDILTVVQPDLVVVCDPSKLDRRGCIGAPDLVVEILSPSTAKKDKKEKFQLYEKVGVKEYWIVEVDNQVIDVYQLGEDGKYSVHEVYGKDDKVKVGIFADLVIDLGVVFPTESF